MASRARVLRKEQEVPSGHDPDDYVSRRILARGHDGEEVPVSLVYRKTTPLDGSAPLLLYGYGSYGMSIPAAFSTNRFSLIDRGFVRSEEHTSELQSLMRISYAVFCLKKKHYINNNMYNTQI